MSSNVKSISAKKLHGRYNLHQSFHDGVNIIHGKNGSGKTTLLHILANALNANYERFVYLIFEQIEVKLDNGTNIKLRKNEDSLTVNINGETIADLNPENVRANDRERHKNVDDFRRNDLSDFEDDLDYDSTKILPVAYFPAFRTMIEAWAAQNKYPRYRSRAHKQERRILMTQFARKLFGEFVPDIIYSSILDIEVDLRRNIDEATFQVARKDRELLSESFLNILPALNKDEIDASTQELKPINLLKDIKTLLEELQESPFEYKPLATRNIYTQLSKTVREFPVSETQEGVAARILKLYKKLLNDRIAEQNQAFNEIETYLDSVNQFLDDKQLTVSESNNSRSKASIVISFNDGTESSLRTLSSGERQIVTLLYAATKMSKQEVVLIDEPEISLHVDWQRSLLKRMSNQLSDRQIITCTHSPVIGADYEKSKQKLEILS